MQLSSSTAPVVIAGAGIGGLTAALALARAGHQVLVLERADQLKEVGAGLQLSPNATQCMAQLGLLPQLRDVSFEPRTILIRSATNGQDLARIPLGTSIEAHHGAPYLVIHRADLQRTLFEKTQETSAIEVRFGCSVEGLRNNSNGLTVTCATEAGHASDIDASVLIGADGVWSKVRETIPRHAEAAFSGRVAYRATVPADSVDPDLLADTGLWLGSNAHLVHYPIQRGRAFNIVAIVQEDWHEQTWSAPADRNALLSRFSSWAAPARSLLGHPDSWLKWALCGVPAQAPWTDGRTALLGDAAHGMLPFAAQGAAMAIEDAMVLADVLTPEAPDVAEALKTYQSRRQQRVGKVQATAEQNGRIYHMSGPLAFARNTTLRLSPPKMLAAKMNWIYGWRPPL
ncbi:FAD-dependent oxidoreductase [Roseibium sp.]|uniref:FAD-dependent oxidoreductase n=1 Tax=Roseibium sp. TaxID=1936156 RepID=UPI003A984106